MIHSHIFDHISSRDCPKLIKPCSPDYVYPWDSRISYLVIESVGMPSGLFYKQEINFQWSFFCFLKINRAQIGPSLKISDTKVDFALNEQLSIQFDDQIIEINDLGHIIELFDHMICFALVIALEEQTFFHLFLWYKNGSYLKFQTFWPSGADFRA